MVDREEPRTVPSGYSAEIHVLTRKTHLGKSNACPSSFSGCTLVVKMGVITDLQLEGKLDPVHIKWSGC